MQLQEDIFMGIKDKLILWIQEIMKEIGGTKAILGISGGKDSSVVAALCKEALTSENVIGVIMPDGSQEDISFAFGLCDLLNINCIQLPIESLTSGFIETIKKGNSNTIKEISKNTRINLPPRVRMTLLYALSQSIPGSRVVNTSNLSERWIGYTTLYGDNTGAFAPLANLTSDEVIELGRLLDLPQDYILKPPADGLTGKTDEDVLGFSYDDLNKYIRQGIYPARDIKDKIDRMHAQSRFKFKSIPGFPVQLPLIDNQ